MDDISKYEIAPLIELEDFQCPEGAKSFFIRGFDNKKLRVASVSYTHLTLPTKA